MTAWVGRLRPILMDASPHLNAPRPKRQAGLPPGWLAGWLAAHPVGEGRAGDYGLAEGADVDAEVCCEAVVEALAGAKLQEALDALHAQLRQAPAPRPYRLHNSQQGRLTSRPRKHSMPGDHSNTAADENHDKPYDPQTLGSSPLPGS